MEIRSAETIKSELIWEVEEKAQQLLFPFVSNILEQNYVNFNVLLGRTGMI